MSLMTRWSHCILCLLLFIQSTCAQKGFVSLQCCADSEVTDPNSNITWITDENWYPDKLNCQQIKRAAQNDTLYDKARFFPSQLGTKWCYNLTAEKDQDYLIRGTFLFGDLQNTAPGSFDVLVGVTQIGLVNSSAPSEVEGILKATNNHFNFCLSTKKGEPYISKLELRPVNSDYLEREPSSVLKVIDRVDVGNTGQEIRYPHDPYDRIWRPELNPDQNATPTSSSSANTTITSANLTVPPIQVLQTALIHPERLEFLHNDLDTGYHEYDLFLYFLELNDSAQVTQRVFDIYINNEKRREIDILAGGSNSYAVVLNFTANGFLNLTMVKASNGSQLGPICNAYEILQVHPWLQETVQRDVDVIGDVRRELLERNQDNEVLKSWSGDPCLPLPWQGLFCEPINGSTVISKLNMSNNGFTGTIPLFPASSALISVDLSHNDLLGKIPESLTSLPYLKTLYVGCNPHLSKELPESFNRSRLKTE
ncbi:unnamed protein product [Ilex paraguariensis]|uniref:Malectin-like domain-containing protein n=1 Tax=Ilex paraguariensis TaxID=185542 RepID=A0ABC8S043_9AQUA